MIGQYGSLSTIVTGPYHGAFDEGLMDVLSQYAPVVRSVTDQLVDPRRQVASLEAQLQDAILKGKPQSKILELQGKLEAARIAVQEEEEFEQSRRDISNLSKVGIAVGIGIGVSLIVLILVRAFRR